MPKLLDQKYIMKSNFGMLWCTGNKIYSVKECRELKHFHYYLCRQPKAAE